MKLTGGKQVLLSPIVIVLSVVIIVGLVCAFIVYQTTQSREPVLESVAEKIPARPISLKANTLFVGDTYWGRYINDWAMASTQKTAYPFSRLGEFNRELYDAWIANLECPTVPGFTQTSAQEDTTISFNCSPDYLPEAAKWFTAVSLANNHTDNRGVTGFTQTKEQLDLNNIQYFGHYDPAVIEDACEVTGLPVTVTYDDKTTKKQKIPAKLRVQTYHAMIDAGADMVIGNHPHWVQSTEAYKGKLIVYSMGNFIFDQQANKEVTRSAAINVVMNTSGRSSKELAAWLILGENCSTFKDQCLQ